MGRRMLPMSFTTWHRNTSIVTVQLESLGIDVVRAMNGKNALQIFETRPKAVLTLS